MKEITRFTPLMMIALLSVTVLSAQGLRERDSVPLKNWDAPMYWQPSAVESKDAAAKQLLAGNSSVDRASSITAQAQTPANSLVFVGMTPCRVVDTRTGSGFTGFFGPPSLAAGVSRIFPIQASTTCSIPTIAQAYSFNITVVPPGFLDFITVWPTGQAQPNASTLNGYVGTVIANAAVVPAGTSGQVNVYASQNTNLIIDINGYYAAQSGITLAQGTASAPALSFAGDPGTGIFSSGAGALNIATGGTSRLSVASNGDLNSTGNLSVSGKGTFGGILSGAAVGVGTSTPATALDVRGALTLDPVDYPTIFTAASGGEQNRYLHLVNSPSLTSGSGLKAGGVLVSDNYLYADPGKNDLIVKGSVGIGTTTPTLGKLHVEGGGNNTGVFGRSSSGHGAEGFSTSGIGVFGGSDSGYAGWFYGNVVVTGIFYQTSDARLKQNVASLGYGLRELLQLRPVTWNWKHKPDQGRQLGLIAQEVETVLPELVTTEKDAEQTKGLNYIGLVPVTIKAIQEQQAQIEDQQKRNAEQQEKLEQQQRQIDSLNLLVCLDHPEAAVCK